jgi:hypothetical protein
VTRGNAQPPNRFQKHTQTLRNANMSRLQHSHRPAMTRPLQSSNLAAAHRAALLRMRIGADVHN